MKKAEIYYFSGSGNSLYVARELDNKPAWQNDVKCYFCYACVNYCPKQSVQIKSKWYMKSYTEENGRYPHPYATAEDIARQKTK